jgi:hypothetical protein
METRKVLLENQEIHDHLVINKEHKNERNLHLTNLLSCSLPVFEIGNKIRESVIKSL